MFFDLIFPNFKYLSNLDWEIDQAQILNFSICYFKDNLFLLVMGMIRSFFRCEGDNVESPFITDKHVFLEIEFNSIQLLLLHHSLAHPELYLIIVVSDLDSDPVHSLDVFVFGAYHAKNTVLPQSVCFLFVDTDSEETTAHVVLVLPLRFNSVLEQVHIAV